jgi:hypothetical protein
MEVDFHTGTNKQPSSRHCMLNMLAEPWGRRFIQVA